MTDASAKCVSGAIGWRQRSTYLAAVVSVLGFCLLCPWHADWVARFNGSQHKDWTRTAVEQAASKSSSRARSGPLHVGVALTDLSDLCRGRPLAGYAARVWRKNDGLAQPISARAVVLDNGHVRLAILSAEILFFNRVLSTLVMEKLSQRDPNWQRDHVFFNATHTHSSPGGFAGSTLEMLGSGAFSESFTERLADRLADVIIKADRTREPAEFAAAAVRVDEGLIRNRTVPSEPANRWLDVCVFRPLGAPSRLTTLVVFGAHPTCQPGTDLRVSGDYPGALCQAVERAVGGVCVFLAGAVGSMAPPYGAAERDRLAVWFGDRLGQDVVEAVRGLGTFQREIPLARLGVRAQLPSASMKLTREWRISPVAAGMLHHSTAWVHAVRVGDRILVGAPADFHGLLAEQIRDAAPPCVTIVTSFNGDYVGYLLPEHYDSIPSYEPRRMSFLGPSAGTEFQAVFARMARFLAQKP
jgi:hypothetical protein